jgi:hypothetical protein
MIHKIAVTVITKERILVLQDCGSFSIKVAAQRDQVFGGF